MALEHIGMEIAALRKEKGITQDELAKHVGVTAQAVSKWENGGIPDTELIPIIADYFGVSTDRLFGRSIEDYGDLGTALSREIINTPESERMKKVLDYCWDMERAIFGNMPTDGSIADYEKAFGRTEQQYSTIMTDHGFTRMGIANRLQYFLVVPDPNDIQAAYFGGTDGLKPIDYPQMFADFSDRVFFDALIMLNKRESTSAFTPNLLTKKLGIDADKADEIIAKLKKYSLINSTKIEMDDEETEVYTFKPTPSFCALLIFAHELIDTPNWFSYYSGGRNKPYLS